MPRRDVGRIEEAAAGTAVAEVVEAAGAGRRRRRRGPGRRRRGPERLRADRSGAGGRSGSCRSGCSWSCSTTSS